MKAATDIWDRANRRGSGREMSKNLFALSICGFTFLGIIASFVASSYSSEWTFPTVWYLLLFVALVVAVGVGGVYVAQKSDKPGVSLLGYGMVAIPFGLLLGPVLAMYTTASIVKVLFITSALVAVLGLVGAVIPDSLEGWGSWLLGGMVALLVGYLVVPIMGAIGIDAGGALTWLDWIGVALFSAMVIYDWNRAMRLPRTLDNSIDAAVAVYLDWLNIFVRLLALLGGRASD